MTTEDEAELKTLLVRLAEGDRSVFSDVFRRLWTPTERLCRGILKNDADAADAAQQAMTKILERASDYDPTRPPLPWAFAIAGWECRTLMKKRSRRRETGVEAMPDVSGAHAEEDIVQRDVVRAAFAAMDELSDIDRETLIASFWEDAGTASGATFRKRRERALARLRIAWRNLYGLE